MKDDRELIWLGSCYTEVLLPIWDISELIAQIPVKNIVNTDIKYPILSAEDLNQIIKFTKYGSW